MRYVTDGWLGTSGTGAYFVPGGPAVGVLASVQPVIAMKWRRLDERADPIRSVRDLAMPHKPSPVWPILEGLWVSALVVTLLGCFLSSSFQIEKWNERIVGFGLWAVALCAGAMYARSRHLKQVKAWQAALGRFCPYCDYDLRASGDRCPECGNLVPPPLDNSQKRDWS